MRDFICDKIKKIKPSGIRRLFDIANEIQDVISLGVGEPDFDTPWHVREEGMYALQKGRTFYTSNAGLPELREEICKNIKRKYGLDYDSKNEVVVTIGGSEAIDIALRALLDPGDEVVYPEPCFVSYQPCILLSDGVPVPIPLSAETEFRLTPEKLEAAITGKTKALLMSYPSNPTGAIMEREDLEKIAEVVLRHDLIVITDEIYSELSYKGTHISIANMPGMQERTILINGFSKAYAMTGWRLGYALAPAHIMEYLLKIHQFAIMSSSYCQPVRCHICTEGRRQRHRDDEGIIRPEKTFPDGIVQGNGASCFEPYGAFYVFPDISEFGMTSEDFCTAFLKAENVAVVPGSAFGECGDKHVRISYAYSVDTLKEAMKRMARFIEGLRQQPF